MLKDFFEGNSVSMEITELYSDYCEETNKKTALNKVYRELVKDYMQEQELYVLLIMTLYYCGLQKGFIHEKHKITLESFSSDFIISVFGEEDGENVNEIIKLLLNTLPAKQVRKKIDYSNPGSKNWQAGDVYACPLTGECIANAKLDGYYAILHCISKHTDTRCRCYVKLYIYLCPKDDITLPLETLLQNSIPLPSFYLYHIYAYMLFSPHHEYPTSELIHLGNLQKYFVPENENTPQKDIFIPLLSWQRFNETISHDYLTFNKLSKLQ